MTSSESLRATVAELIAAGQGRPVRTSVTLARTSARYGFVAPEDLRDEAENALADARDRLQGRVPAHFISVPADSPARALTEVSEAEHADLVVVGSSHRGALGRVVLGTTAERLLHGAPCAVAVPPRGYKGGDVRHVGVAYDGSSEARCARRGDRTQGRRRG